ncbi:hypothetical protein [Ruminococcus sp. Marseille-P6503]|uniref:hypothetical protein n=1 Tax=Ruminococcus sp. Marseille-P6503 TaxID=2364796 RepID=UPI000F54AF75|nr:hypothetical protein [Ruminococcus sp. Marseille-P6503]
MKTIIDGFKYDTETAVLVMSYLLNKYEKGELYRNRKYKFFSLNMLQKENDSEKELKYDYKIIPLTKQQAMELLINYEKIDEYEKLFGEIPEAEGEDFIPESEEDNVLTAENEYITAEIPEPAEIDKADKAVPAIEKRTRPLHRVQKKLLAACEDNDIKTGQACITCGAVPGAAHIRKAILYASKDILRLILADFPDLKISKKEIRLAVLKGDTEIFKLIIEKRPDLAQYALKISKKYLIVPIVEYLDQSVNFR